MRDIGICSKVVIKIGSTSLFNQNNEIDYIKLESLIEQIKILNERNIDVIIVSSGAIALGRICLGFENNKLDLVTKQALASIGQTKLNLLYSNLGEKYNLKFGQVLVNHDDFEKRDRVKHLKNTITKMLELKIIPIINENDTLAVQEIKVGDNDTLSSLITSLLKANLLILFSDIDGLYDKNPKEYSDAKLIKTVKNLGDVTNYASNTISNFGTGGMITKLSAARIALNVNAKMIICNNNKMNCLTDIVDGKEIGTIFLPAKNIKAYDHWLIYNTKSKGSIIIDCGLYEMLMHKRVSILPKGITLVVGNFNKNDIVSIVYNDKVIAKGICNYGSEIIDFVKGKDSKMLYIFGDKTEIIHADALVRIED